MLPWQEFMGLFDVVSKISVLGLMALIILAIWRRWFIPGWMYYQLREDHAGAMLELRAEIARLEVDRNEWKRLAINSVNLSTFMAKKSGLDFGQSDIIGDSDEN